MFGLLQPGPLINAISTVLLLSMGYLLLRLVDDFSDVPFWLMRGAEIALALFALSMFAFAPPLPPALAALMLIYLVGLLLYSAISFARESRQSSGVTRRRMQAAAHDLKTPLTTLIAKAQLMERQAIRNPAAPANLAGLQLLVREGQRLKQIVLELLDAARAEQGNLVGERAPIDLVALSKEICARHNAAGHHCTIESRRPAIGMCDPFRITQLLENLTENAIKYSPLGGEIRLNISSDDDRAYLSVSDQGIGIPAHDLPHIFERFYRATNVDDRRFAGMGLGLFICRGIVEQHGGRIYVKSRPAMAARFMSSCRSRQ